MGSKRNLHDLSSVRSRRLRISLDPSPMYDLLLVLWSTFGGDDKAESHTLGKRWFDEFRNKLSDETRSMAVELSPFGEIWAALLVVVDMAPGDHSIDSVLGWLEGADPHWLRETLLAEKFWEVDPEIRVSAARGEADGVAAILEAASKMKLDDSWCQSLESFLELPAERVLPLLVDTVRRARTEGFSEYEEDWAAAQSRDAGVKRQLVADYSSPTDLIENITNGISYGLAQGIHRLVLIPSVALRPWTLITDHDDALLLLYPVAEENLTLDPEAPPASLLAVYRALGDEKRMRLLRRLAEGPATLAELTEHLGLAKSTVFHHMGVLRAAGLVRVQLVDGQVSSYSLRLDSIPDHGSLLKHYLTPFPAEPEGATR